MIELTAYRGDSMSFTIPLTNGTAAFTPGGFYSLIFTAKRSSKDPDTAAVFQKSTATGTITTSTTNAIVTVLYTDTTTEEEPVLYWDIQAQHNSTAAVITAAKGTLTLVRDITRQTTASVPIYTVDPAAGGGGATPAGTTGSVQINNSGALAADSGLVYTGTGNSGKLTVGGGRIYMDATTGSAPKNNVAIGGSSAGLPFSAVGFSGSLNVSIGAGNLTSITTGVQNVACGSYSLYQLTTGSSNLGIGNNTLTELTSGVRNIALGSGAGGGITTGNDNIFINRAAVNGTLNCQIAIGGTSDGASSTVIGFDGASNESPTTQTRFIGNTIIWGDGVVGNSSQNASPNNRTSLVQSATTSAKTITLPNVTGNLPVYTDTPAAGQVLVATDASGAATWETPTSGGVTSITAGTGLSGGTITTTGTIALANTAVTAQSYTNADITVDAQGRITAAANGSSAGSVTGTAPIVVTSGVVSLSTTLPSAYAFTSTTRPTSAATTGTLAAADVQSLITKGDADSRYAFPSAKISSVEQTSATNVIVQLTGLQDFTLESSKYYKIEIYGEISSTLSTSSFFLGFTASGGLSNINTDSLTYQSGSAQIGNNGSPVALWYQTNGYRTQATMATTSRQNIYFIAYFKTSASGTLSIQFKNANATGIITVHAGMMGSLTKLY